MHYFGIPRITQSEIYINIYIEAFVWVFLGILNQTFAWSNFQCLQSDVYLSYTVLAAIANRKLENFANLYQISDLFINRVEIGERGNLQKWKKTKSGQRTAT